MIKIKPTNDSKLINKLIINNLIEDLFNYLSYLYLISYFYQLYYFIIISINSFINFSI